MDSLVIEDDQKFLKDVDTARVIAQLGYRLEIFVSNVFIFISGLPAKHSRRRSFSS